MQNVTKQQAINCNPGTCVIDCKEIMLLVGAVDDHLSSWIVFDLSADEPMISHVMAPAKFYRDDVIVCIT